MNETPKRKNDELLMVAGGDIYEYGYVVDLVGRVHNRPRAIKSTSFSTMLVGLVNLDPFFCRAWSAPDKQQEFRSSTMERAKRH